LNNPKKPPIIPPPAPDVNIAKIVVIIFCLVYFSWNTAHNAPIAAAVKAVHLIPLPIQPITLIAPFDDLKISSISLTSV
ncbi:MAG: hypothetical protein KAT90_09165, partial [Gammaproteobacteria bacterium]|nr:hypothetical protein [Gammaproteobacteria bacterium]